MDMLYQLGVSVLKTFFTKGVTTLWNYKDELCLYFKTILIPKYRKVNIRFSLSYIYRIQIPNTNKYLLVFNRKIQNQLQPVGGVYKRYGDDKLFEKWGYMPDSKENGFNVDKISYEDLRFKVKGRYAIDVIRWFDEEKEREVSAEREFKEELIDTEILDKNLFDIIRYKKIRRKSKLLKWSKYHKCYEVLIYDIIEFLPNSKQSEYLENLAKTPFKNGKYAIVNLDEISSLRYFQKNEREIKIGEHTKHIINYK